MGDDLMLATAHRQAQRDARAPRDFLTTNEVGEMLNTPPATLRFWRHQGIGPRSFTLGPRQVRYRRADVEAWVAEQYQGQGSDIA